MFRMTTENFKPMQDSTSTQKTKQFNWRMKFGPQCHFPLIQTIISHILIFRSTLNRLRLIEDERKGYQIKGCDLQPNHVDEKILIKQKPPGPAITGLSRHITYRTCRSYQPVQYRRSST